MTTPPALDTNLPYAGLRVLDLSQGIAGPYCAQILQELGADVIKVEPLDGDWSRRIGLARDHMSATTLAFNRGKRSLACDARHPQGQALLGALAAQSDIVVQSFRPGVADRLGLGADRLRAAQPSLIYVSISGFGLSGPQAQRAATDSVAQAASGLAMANRAADGTPATAKPYIADQACGLYAANAVGAALFARERAPDRRGAHLDVSLLACMAALQNNLLFEKAWQGDAPASGGTVPQGIYDTADGHLALASTSDAMFGAIADVVGQPAWRTDPCMATAAARLQVAPQIQGDLQRILRTRGSAEWVTAFAAAQVLAAEVRHTDQLPTDVQVQHLGLLQALPHPEGPGLPDLPCFGLPGLSPGLHRASAPAPRLGEHTTDILRTLHYSDAQIDALRDAGVIAHPTASRSCS